MLPLIFELSVGVSAGCGEPGPGSGTDSPGGGFGLPGSTPIPWFVGGWVTEEFASEPCELCGATTACTDAACAGADWTDCWNFLDTGLLFELIFPLGFGFDRAVT